MSACEFLATTMQDGNVATIFGETRATYGSVASVLSHERLHQVYNWRFYKPLPYNIRMSTPISVSVRGNGKPLEITGVTPDVLVPPTREDILFPRKGSTQFDKIADVLRDVGIKTGKSKLYCKLLPHLNSIPAKSR
jgi:C-terminal processing protease CtpA/Prc